MYFQHLTVSTEMLVTVMIFKADLKEILVLLTIFGDHCVGHSDWSAHFDFQLEFAQLVVQLDVRLQPVGSLDGRDLRGGNIASTFHARLPICCFLAEPSQAKYLPACIWIVPQHLLLLLNLLQLDPRGWPHHLFGTPSPTLTHPGGPLTRPFLPLGVQKVTVLITEVALRPELDDALHLFVRWHSGLLRQGKLQKLDC